MPRNKDLKRLVRARMTKTGEAYTAARAQITKKPGPPKRAAAPELPDARPAAAPTPTDYAAIAGMSDEALEGKTGCTWKRWVDALDAQGAAALSHRDIAKLVTTKYKVGPWWGQTVTVGYERIKGLRARGQRRDGAFEASKSRTYKVPVETLFEAWSDGRIRRRWLDGASVKVRTATAPKSMRLDWADGAIIEVNFVSKGKSKSAVAVAHTKLPDKEAVARMKLYWSGRLDALGEVLEPGSD